MFKKSILVLLISCAAYLMQITNAMATFDPEKDSDFTKMDTIKKWVAPMYHENFKLMEAIQNAVSLTVLQNQHARKVINNINYFLSKKRDTGVDFGFCSGTLEPSELLFLKTVREVSESKKNIKTLELAAGPIGPSWKVPLAYVNGGKHYVNNLSEIALNVFKKYAKDNYYKHTAKLAQKNFLDDHIEILQGDCLKIVNDHPGLKKNIDVIYVQNLEHFLNPRDHRLFLQVVSDLLAPRGIAILVMNNLRFNPEDGTAGFGLEDDDKNLYKLYKHREKSGNEYPGFLKVTEVDVLCQSDFECTSTKKIIKAKSPEDSAVIHNKKIGKSKIENNFFGKKTTIKQTVTMNYFSPTIYRNLITSRPQLKLKYIESFYIDFSNEKAIEWNKDVGQVVVVIQKKDDEKVDYKNPEDKKN